MPATKSSPKAAKRKGGKSATDQPAADRVTIQNVNVPGYSSTVDAGMYNAMKKALLKVLPGRAPGLTQSEMFTAVVPHLPNALFPGGAKAGWWVKCVQLDLEAKRRIVREPSKPLRWHKRGGG
jgi:hypothetical protein